MTKDQQHQWFCEYLGMSPQAYVERGLQLLTMLRNVNGPSENPPPHPLYHDKSPLPTAQNKNAKEVC